MQSHYLVLLIIVKYHHTALLDRQCPDCPGYCLCLLLHDHLFQGGGASTCIGFLYRLIVGQFTDYKPDANHDDMESMFRDAIAGYSFPVAFNVPVGHVDHNIPLIEGAPVTLKVSPSGRNSIIFINKTRRALKVC